MTGRMRRRSNWKRSPLSASARGYGYAHQKLRAWWAPQVAAGIVPCHATLCLEEQDGRTRSIRPGTPWHLGHNESRTAWTGPEHARCNIRDGAVRAAIRSNASSVTMTVPRSRQW
jgi:hypothetical protein